MKFSFIISTTCGVSDGDMIRDVITSIETQGIPKHSYEIIVIGGVGNRFSGQNLLHISWDERDPYSFTNKKNFGARAARYENLVLLHNYVKLLPKWYNNFVDFGDEWDVCMTRVLNQDGSRYRDWLSLGDPELGAEWRQVEPWCKNGLIHRGPLVMVPYDYSRREYYAYSGAYLVIKKETMLKHPLLSLPWARGEDVEHSMRLRSDPATRWELNIDSSVQLLKHKDIIVREVYAY